MLSQLKILPQIFRDVLSSNNLLPSHLTQSIRCLAELIVHNIPSWWCKVHKSKIGVSTNKNMCSRLRYKWPGIGRKNHHWEPRLPVRERYEHTLEPIYLPRTGGRGPNGRIKQYRVGGGFLKKFYMVDFVRGGDESDTPLEEKVMRLETYDFSNSKIALVVRGENKRWIVASHSTQVGDTIKSTNSTNITNLKEWKEGDALPLCNLPMGSLVHAIPRQPGGGAIQAIAAGACAQIIRFHGDDCILRLPSRQDIQISSKCQVVIGKASYDGYSLDKLNKAGESRWRGIKPRSGLFHKKDGRQGRKINPPKKLKDFTAELPASPGRQRQLYTDMNMK